MPEAALLCLEPPFYVWSRPFMPGAALLCLEPPIYAWNRSRPNLTEAGIGSET